MPPQDTPGMGQTLMDILQNKKALAGIVAGVVLVMAVFFYFFSGEGGGDNTEFAPDNGPGTTPTASAPGAVPGAAGPMGPTETPPGGAPIAGPSSLSAAGATTAASKPLPPSEPHRADPFAPLIPRPKPNPATLAAQAAEREIASLPPLTIYRTPETTLAGATGSTVIGAPGAAQEQPDTSQRRVAGIVAGKNVSAILEVDGQTAVVKPGDVLPDLSRVERIERDRVLLRKGTRAIFVPLASNPTGGAGGGAPITAGPAGPYGVGGRMRGVPPPGMFRRGG